MRTVLPSLLVLVTAVYAVESIPATVNFGSVDADAAAISRRLVIKAEPGAVIESLRASCSCLSAAAEGLPFRFGGDKRELSVSVALKPDDLFGEVRKSVFVRYRAATGERRMLAIPVLGTVADGDVPAVFAASAPKAATAPGTTPYDGRPAEKLTDAIVAFVSPNCPRCAWLLNDWLPAYRKAHPKLQVFTADLDTDAGLNALLKFEESAKAVGEDKDRLPVIYRDKQLVYGTKAIEEMLKP